MKTLSVLSLSILLAACGGSSSSSNKESKPAEVAQTATATYEKALSICGDNLKLNISNHTVNGSGEKYVLTPETDARLDIEGSGHKICISGDMKELVITGTGHDVFVNGKVSTLNINGTGHDVYVFGDTLSISLLGIGHEVWAESVATYNDNGSANKIMKISSANL